MAPQQLQLRIDSQVMMIKNTDETLVNGSMGKVIDFVNPKNFPEDGEDEDEKSKAKSKSKAKAESMVTKYPLVRFNTGAPGEHRDIIVMPETWKVESQGGLVLASRMQVRNLVHLDSAGSSLYRCLAPFDIVLGNVYP